MESQWNRNLEKINSDICRCASFRAKSSNPNEFDPKKKTSDTTDTMSIGVPTVNSQDFMSVIFVTLW